MSFTRFLRELNNFQLEIQQDTSSGQLYYNNRNSEIDEKRLEELLVDLTDYSAVKGNPALTSKLRSLQKDDKDRYGHNGSSTTELTARTLRAIRAVETFGRDVLESEVAGSKIAVSEAMAVANVEDDPKISDKVFIVHGHDNATLYRVKETLLTLGLKPIVLREQANSGKTVIEKFERFSDVGFAVILMTEDDMGGSLADMESDRASPRARQNVIMELGFFASKLGRGKISVLKASGVEAPSDIMGVVYTPIDEGEAWRLSLAQELKSAGYEVDLNRLV